MGDYCFNGPQLRIPLSVDAWSTTTSALKVAWMKKRMGQSSATCVLQQVINLKINSKIVKNYSYYLKN
jgi:hypothetical protein